MTTLGLQILDVAPERAGEAVGYLERAVVVARDGPMLRNTVRSLVNLARARQQTGPPAEAREAALLALDAIERLDDLQTGETIGAINFSVYAPAYYRLIGAVLRDEPTA